MPCLSFTTTVKRVPNARDCVLARIDNTWRSSRAETNPSSYDSSIDTFRSSATSGFLGTGLASGPPRGGRSPRKPGTDKTDRGQPRARRWILLDTHTNAHYIRETFVLTCLMYVARLGGFFYTANIATKYRVITIDDILVLFNCRWNVDDMR